jgi:hypothetical protein
MKSSVMRMNQFSGSKVNVLHWKTLVRNKSSACIEGFQYNFAQMYTIVWQSVACKIQVPATKVKVTNRSQISDDDTEMCIWTI